MLRMLRKRLGLDGLRRRLVPARLKPAHPDDDTSEAQAFYAAQEISAKVSRAYQARRRKAR